MPQDPIVFRPLTPADCKEEVKDHCVLNMLATNRFIIKTALVMLYLPRYYYYWHVWNLEEFFYGR